MNQADFDNLVERWSVYLARSVGIEVADNVLVVITNGVPPTEYNGEQVTVQLVDIPYIIAIGHGKIRDKRDFLLIGVMNIQQPGTAQSQSSLGGYNASQHQ